MSQLINWFRITRMVVLDIESQILALFDSSSSVLFIYKKITERKHNDGLYVLTHKTVFENQNRNSSYLAMFIS